MCIRDSVGTDVRSAVLVNIEGKEGLEIPVCTVVQQLQEVLAPTENFERLRPGKLLENGIYEASREKAVSYTHLDVYKRQV